MKAAQAAFLLSMGIWLSGCPGSNSTSVTTTAAPGQTIGCPAGLNLLSASCCNASGVQITFNSNCPPPFTPDNPPTVPAAQMAASASQALSNATAVVGNSLAMIPGGSGATLPPVTPLSGAMSPHALFQSNPALAASASGTATPKSAAALGLPSSFTSPALTGGAGAGTGGIAGMGGLQGFGGMGGYAGGNVGGGASFAAIGGGMGSPGTTAPGLGSTSGSAPQGPMPVEALGNNGGGDGVGMMSAGGVGNAPPSRNGGVDFSSLLGGASSGGGPGSAPQGAGAQNAQFAGNASRALASVDPTDYFSRSSSYDSLFKLVEWRYQQTQLGWNLSAAHALGQRMPAARGGKVGSK